MAETGSDAPFSPLEWRSKLPIVLTHDVPKRHPKETENLTFTFVTDGIESATPATLSASPTPSKKVKA